MPWYLWWIAAYAAWLAAGFPAVALNSFVAHRGHHRLAGNVLLAWWGCYALVVLYPVGYGVAQ